MKCHGRLGRSWHRAQYSPSGDRGRYDGVLSLLLFPGGNGPSSNPRDGQCEPLHEPRYPTEEINLATFVTRRQGIWSRRYFNEVGDEFFVDKDY